MFLSFKREASQETGGCCSKYDIRLKFILIPNVAKCHSSRASIAIDRSLAYDRDTTRFELEMGVGQTSNIATYYIPPPPPPPPTHTQPPPPPHPLEFVQDAISKLTLCRTNYIKLARVYNDLHLTHGQ